MVEVKFNLMKRDIFWIVLLIVLVGIRFGYSWGGVSPSIMGHSGGEIMLDRNTVIDDGFCNKVVGHACGYDDGGEAGAVNDLVNGIHSSDHCISLGGEVMTNDTEGKVCKLPRACINYGWAQFKSWRQTKSQTCNCIQGLGDLVGSTCTTGSSWKNSAGVETCNYKKLASQTAGGCILSSICSATITHYGCY